MSRLTTQHTPVANWSAHEPKLSSCHRQSQMSWRMGTVEAAWLSQTRRTACHKCSFGSLSVTRKDPDQESFAAAAEVAVAWRYMVAARWWEHAFAGRDALVSRRRLGARRTAVGQLAQPTPFRDVGQLPPQRSSLAPRARVQTQHADRGRH